MRLREERIRAEEEETERLLRQRLQHEKAEKENEYASDSSGVTESASESEESGDTESESESDSGSTAKAPAPKQATGDESQDNDKGQGKEKTKTKTKKPKRKQDKKERIEGKKQKKKLVRKRPRLPSASDEEEEADLDNIGFCGNGGSSAADGTGTATTKQSSAFKIPTKKMVRSWSKEETTSLVQMFENLKSSDPHLARFGDPREIVLRVEEDLGLRVKTVDDIRHQLERLRLIRATKIADKSKNNNKFSPGREIEKAFITIVDRGNTSWIRWVQSELEDGHSVLVPVETTHFEALESKLFQRILVLLGLHQPQEGRPYWRLELDTQELTVLADKVNVLIRNAKEMKDIKDIIADAMELVLPLCSEV